jgi:hypothetical protein
MEIERVAPCPSLRRTRVGRGYEPVVRESR